MKFNEDLPVRQFFNLCLASTYLESFTVDRHPSDCPADLLLRLLPSFPCRRMHDRTRTCPPAKSLARKSTSTGRTKQLLCICVQFRGYVFHSVVVPDGAFGQRIHCGYASSLPYIERALTHLDVLGFGPHVGLHLLPDSLAMGLGSLFAGYATLFFFPPFLSASSHRAC